MLFVITTNVFISPAQQSSNKPVPSLSADEVMTRTLPTVSDGVWKRYSPEGFGISFELPGDPNERSYPVPPELRSQISAAKIFDYAEESFIATVTHIVLAKRMELMLMAREMRKSLYRSDDFQNVKISLIPKQDRVLVSGSFSRFGREIDVRGFFVGSGEEVWFVFVQIVRDRQEGSAACARILDSVTRNR